jgi:hypothetical protein
MGVVNAALAVSDVFLVKSLATAAGKLVLKVGAKALPKPIVLAINKQAGGTIVKSLATVESLTAQNLFKKAVVHGHHPLPKFLGGYADQVLSKLNPIVHKEFHSLLKQKLKQAGIPLNVGGRGGSARDWAMYMNANPGAQKAALNAVLDASRAIDKKYGTTITQKVWENIIAANFTAFP